MKDKSRPKRGRLSALGLAFATAAAGCSSTPTSSVIAGTIEKAGLPAGEWKITLVNDRGDILHAKVDERGSFHANLKQGAAWTLYLTSADAALPMVLRQTDG